MSDVKTVADNIYRIAKLRGMRIGDIEVRADVSAGYLSRLRKRETVYSLSVERLFTFADILGVEAAALLSEPSAERMEYTVHFETIAFSDMEPTEQRLRTIHEIINHYLAAGVDEVDFVIRYSQLRLIRDGHIAETSTIDEEKEDPNEQ